MTMSRAPRVSFVREATSPLAEGAGKKQDFDLSGLRASAEACPPVSRWIEDVNCADVSCVLYQFG